MPLPLSRHPFFDWKQKHAKIVNKFFVRYDSDYTKHYKINFPLCSRIQNDDDFKRWRMQEANSILANICKMFLCST